MIDALGRENPSPTIAAFRRYVTDFVNRGDFSVIGEFMAEDYALSTSGLTISGRDGPYRAAVASQLDQFPGLSFTPHELFQVGERIGIRFTEHGASTRHDGACAAWPSIAIYTVRDGLLAACAIEQDYTARRRQLDTGVPDSVDPPAAAPWDVVASPHDAASEGVVRAWLASAALLATPGVQIDDSYVTNEVATIIDRAAITVLDILSGDGKVVFHALQQGELAADFAGDADAGQPVHIHLSGLVTVADGEITAGSVIRDRWGLRRRLAPRL